MTKKEEQAVLIFERKIFRRIYGPKYEDGEWKSSSLSGRPDRPRTQHDCHHDTKVKPEAATAVIELLIMGGKTP